MATDNKMQRILGAIGRFISKPIPKTVLLLCFAAIIGTGAYGMSQIKVRRGWRWVALGGGGEVGEQAKAKHAPHSGQCGLSKAGTQLLDATWSHVGHQGAELWDITGHCHCGS